MKRVVGCCWSYLAENMNPEGLKEPLLEAQLELREPDLYYVPSLEQDDPDGLEQLVAGMLNDILGMAALIPRIHSTSPGYSEELEKDEDILAMKSEITQSVAKAVEEATDFCEVFEG